MHKRTLYLALVAATLAPMLCRAAPATPSCPAPATEFAPGQVSTPDWFESRLAFTPSRNTIYWGMTTEPQPFIQVLAAAIR